MPLLVISNNMFIKIDSVGVFDLSNSSCNMISNFDDGVNMLNNLYFKGDFEAASKRINSVYNLAVETEESIRNEEHFRRTLTKFFGIAGDIEGELGHYENALHYYKNFQCLRMQLKTNLCKANETLEFLTLYQFRKFTDYTLNNLAKSEITLSRPTEMNDIVDTPVFLWLNSPSFGSTSKFKGHLEAFKQSFSDYRIASFCENNIKTGRHAVQNSLMWAHYAADHTGFCVEYKFHRDDIRQDDLNNLTASRMVRMNYSDPRLNPLNFETLNTLFIDKAFYTKSIDWMYENEVRLIQFKPNNGDVRVQYKLSDKTKVIAIYFGKRCPADNISKLKTLLKDRDIKYYKMDIDFSNVHRLKYSEI